MNHTPVIAEALSHGIAGDECRGLELIQPLVDAGPDSTYALLGGLAEVATCTARQTQPPGTVFAGPLVENTVTGEQASADVLEPPLKFVTQFVAAWANRDQDTALALFKAFGHESDRAGTPDLGDAIGLLYSMAVITSAEVIRAAREARKSS